MPKLESIPNGAPCWIDLMTSDPDKTQAFYGELFGWKADDPGPEYGGYKRFLKDDVLVAGFMKNDGSGAPDGWSIYLASDDAQATVDQAAAHGGQVYLAPMQILELGSMAMIADPGSASIGIWQPGLHKGFGVVAEPGAPAWFELHTRDYDATVQFYRDVFGWDTHAVSDTPEFRYTTLGEGDDQAAGIMDGSAYLPEGVPAQWSVYFNVENAEKTLAKVEQLGGTIAEPAADTPYGVLAAALDPTGARFKLQQPS